MREETEIAVIGAGPSGLIAAREASKMGAKVVILEEHGEIGLPCHCAGLLSISGLNRIGLAGSRTYILNMVRGVRLFSPSSVSITIEWKKPIACVIDRHLFDVSLAEQAQRSGSLIRLKSKVTRASKEKGGWLLKTEGGDIIKAKLVIDAEGALPKIPRMIGIETHDSKRLLKGVQADLLLPGLDPDYIEVYFSRSLAPGLFAWVIPLNDEVARVGLACRAPDAMGYFINFVKKRFSAPPKKILKYYFGLVITCGPIRRTYGDGLLIVGDSAGHSKPITGGGVIFGGICARIAGRVASKAVMSGSIRGKFLRAYEEEWRSMIGNELKRALLVRKILNNLSDRDMDKIFSIAVREKVHDEVVLRGANMDYQAITLIKVLRWKILKFTPVIFRAFIHSIIGEKTVSI
ncbi:MAG: NAD(P)/FAD-dependent oxidoreductase [Candidatus Bathyarchaeia archaeon]